MNCPIRCPPTIFHAEGTQKTSEKKCFSTRSSLWRGRTNSVQWQATCKYPAPPSVCNWICNAGKEKGFAVIPLPVTANGSCLSLSRFRWHGNKLPRGTVGKLLQPFGFSTGWCSEERNGWYIDIMGIWQLHTPLKKHSWSTNPPWQFQVFLQNLSPLPWWDTKHFFRDIP